MALFKRILRFPILRFLHPREERQGLPARRSLTLAASVF
jgi:hypothetical protein